MKLTTLLHIALLCVAAISIPGCACFPGSSQPKWRHVTEVPEARPPRGTVVSTDNGSVLTLPNGKKFISKNNGAETTLRFPNRQVFRAETAKGGFQPPYVSDDERLVASVVIPSTQSGDLHLFVVGADGRYREISNVNEKITKVLERAGAPFGASALRILDLKCHTLSVASVDFGQHRGEADLFAITVARDGTLSLGH